MLDVIGFIFRTAKREVGLVTSVKLAIAPALLFGWKGLAQRVGWDDFNPSFLTTSLTTVLIVALSLLYIIAKSAKPNFKLSLPHGGLSQTPLSSATGSGTGNYVRFCVETDSGVAVNNCSASIIDIQKRKPEDADFMDVGFTDRVELEWSHSGHEKVRDLNPYEPMYLAIASASTLNNNLTIETPQEFPYKYLGLLSGIAIYRFKVRVTGDKVSKLITIDVDWKENWDTITVSRGPDV